MKRNAMFIVVIFVALLLFLSFTTHDPIKSQFTSSNEFQHKEFGSSNSLDGKPLILSQSETYKFHVKAKMKKGFLSVTVLNEDRNKEFLRIKGSNIDETKEISFNAGQ